VAGTITVFQPRFASEFPRSLSAHDIGLRDLVEPAALFGYHPKPYLLTVSVSPEGIQSLNTDLSATAAAAVPELCLRVREIVDNIIAGPPQTAEQTHA